MVYTNSVTIESNIVLKIYNYYYSISQVFYMLDEENESSSSNHLTASSCNSEVRN